MKWLWIVFSFTMFLAGLICLIKKDIDYATYYAVLYFGSMIMAELENNK